MQPELAVRDVVLGMGACTDSNYASQFCLPGTYAPTASYELLSKAVAAIEKMGNIRYRVGNLLSSDAFYNDNPADDCAVAEDGCACCGDGGGCVVYECSTLRKKCACDLHDF